MNNPDLSLASKCWRYSVRPGLKYSKFSFNAECAKENDPEDNNNIYNKGHTLHYT
jgi:hypothetical protein